jgi:CheY-like chemotaxis protein
MNQIRLLLVDDDGGFRSATSQALARRGFSVRQAESGERALELIVAETPDVVVLDLRMPGMGGMETLERIRAGHVDLPVIILTGHGDYAAALEGIRLQVVDFLQKPVDVAELAARIRRLLTGERRSPLRERAIAELLVPATAYRRVQADEPVRRVIGVMRDELFPPGSEGSVREQGRRTVLVYDGGECFVGCLRLGQLLELVLPPFLRQSPYASFFTGMFLAQCKVVGHQPVGELVTDHSSVAIDAPLIEAIHLLVTRRLINLPVMRGGELVGLLRDKDLLLEVAEAVLGGARGDASPG